MKTKTHFDHISLHYFHNDNFFDEHCRENQNTHIIDFFQVTNLIHTSFIL